MRKIVTTICLVQFLTVLTIGQTISKPKYFPEGWVIPSAELFKENTGWAYFLAKGNAFPFYTTGDFNGDKSLDYVWNLLKVNGETWEVFCFMSNNVGGFDVIDIGGKRASHTDPMNLYVGEITKTEISFFRKGEYLCQFDTNMNITKKIKSEYDVLLFGYFEGDRVALYFNPATKKFDKYFRCMD